jgi:hypothetical protein
MAPTPLRAPEGGITIDNTDGLREKLRGYDWSFSSLKLFFTCPFRFIIEKVDGVKPPPCFEGEEHANLLIGDFLHRLFADLTTRTPALDRWQEGFNDRWESDADLCGKLPDRAVRKAIVQSHLADIAAWERESRRPLLFSDEVTATEIELAAPFGNGRYRLKGRIDRLQRCGEKLLIADLKYREKEHVSGKTRLADLVEKPDSFDERFQLLIYAYLVLHHERATPENLEAAYLYLRPRVRGDYEGRLAHEDVATCNATMERIAGRLDKMLGLERFAPNPRSEAAPSAPTRPSASGPTSTGQEASHGEEPLRHRLGRFREDLPPDPGGAPPHRTGGRTHRGGDLHPRRYGRDGKADHRGNRERPGGEGRKAPAHHARRQGPLLDDRCPLPPVPLDGGLCPPGG